MQKKWNSIDWKGLKRSAVKARQSTASSMKNWVMTDIENLAREVTADTTWGASGTQLDEVARATYNRDDYALVMGILWQRLTSRRWRCVYKGLELLKHLMFHGSSRVVDEARDAKYHIQALEGFRYIDSRTGKDDGQNVRSKAKEVYDLIDNPRLLDEEREKSKALKAKLGIAAPSSYGGGYGGYGDSGEPYGSGGSRIGSTSAYTYQYDEELDGPMDKGLEESAAGGKQQESAAAVAPAPTADDLLELGDEPYTAGPVSGQPTVEFFDDDDDAFNPRAQALPAPGDDAADPLGTLLGLEPSPSAALPPVTAPLQIEAAHTSEPSLSSNIFGGLSKPPTSSTVAPASSPGDNVFGSADPFAPVTASNSSANPTSSVSKVQPATSFSAGAKRELSSNKTTGGGGLDAFDGILDLSSLTVTNKPPAKPTSSGDDKPAVDEFF